MSEYDDADESGSGFESTYDSESGLYRTKEMHAHNYVSRRFTHPSWDELPIWVPDRWAPRGGANEFRHYEEQVVIEEHDLSWYQSMFVALDFPHSCKMARLYHYFTVFIVVLQVVIGYMSSSGVFQITPTTCDKPACSNDAIYCPGAEICAPQPWMSFLYIDFACFIAYFADLFIRMTLSISMPITLLQIGSMTWAKQKLETWKKSHKAAKGRLFSDMISINQEAGRFEKFVKYSMLVRNVVDQFATYPYLILLIINLSHGRGAFSTAINGSVTTIMSVRIARCFRLLKVLDIHPSGGPKLGLIVRTMTESFPSLRILLGFLCISAVIFGAVIYSVERGDFIVNSDYPAGAYLRRDMLDQDYELSPFKNLGACMYWAIVTMSTLGYGDMYPTSTTGRLVGCICTIYGVLMISLPVTIINNAFSTELNAYQKAVEVEKKKVKERKHSRLMAIMKRAQSTRNPQTFFDVVDDTSNNKLSTGAGALVGMGVGVGSENVDVELHETMDLDDSASKTSSPDVNAGEKQQQQQLNLDLNLSALGMSRNFRSPNPTQVKKKSKFKNLGRAVIEAERIDQDMIDHEEKKQKI